jgi:hypothetical protein
VRPPAPDAAPSLERAALEALRKVPCHTVRA